MSAPDAPVALVTGANRGIGREVCRQLARLGWSVLLGARDPEQGIAAAAALAAEDLAVVPIQLDVCDDASVAAARRDVDDGYGRLDVLVNNAATGFGSGQRVADLAFDDVVATITTNLLGPWRTVREFLPLLRRSRAGRIVNVSSVGGSFGADPGLARRGIPAYSVSKAALNAFTVKLAVELRAEGILVNAVCPGYTATSPVAAGGRPLAEGAAGVVWAAMLSGTGPTGRFFRDREPLPW